jgi:hypothetical protein
VLPKKKKKKNLQETQRTQSRIHAKREKKKNALHLNISYLSYRKPKIKKLEGENIFLTEKQR